uniref:Polymerase PA n=1 Tax=Astopletus virus TaxID=2800905 RepID=A0A894KPN3_9VIRU|nr:MAG: polymerase PA [Astopletus virus]QRW42565.1 MAG: polymerase PA [Astopletus virus]
MVNLRALQDVIENGNLYPNAFVAHFGQRDSNWARSGIISREKSLRHDMVCLLIGNLEPIPSVEEQPLDDFLEPPPKRMRLDIDAGEGSSRSTASGSSSSSKSDAADAPPGCELVHGTERRLRYVLLEGKSNVSMLQNRLADLYGVSRPSKHYDLFDKVEKKFIEVKVYLSLTRAYMEFESYSDPIEIRSLVHAHPVTGAITTRGKTDPMPGATKAKDFLLRRLEILSDLGYTETDVDAEADLAGQVFNCGSFNNLVNDWAKATFLDKLRQHEEIDRTEVIRNPVIKVIEEEDLKSCIEDTKKRSAPFMQFHGKILPPPFVEGIETNVETDAEMVELLLNNLTFIDGEKANVCNAIVKTWESSSQNTFNLATRKSLKHLDSSLARDLGIDRKQTINWDGHPSLRQAESKAPEPRRYSAWMSNLVTSLSKVGDMDCFENLAVTETEDPHKMAQVASEINNTYFRHFSKTRAAEYCSMIKNTYSRLGGSYLKRGYGKKDTPEVVIFPVYAVGKKDGVTTRRVTGLLIRGPQHARKPTDKIPIITLELVNTSNDGFRYKDFVKKAHFVKDDRKRIWFYRVNSISNVSTSYLPYIINSTYLGANLVGEMTMGHPSNLANYDAAREAATFVSSYGEWLMERVVESILMAVIGGPQEEGALAIVRKIFMLKLNWYRERPAMGCDVRGLAEALNECLIDSPLALYFGEQARLSLRGRD